MKKPAPAGTPEVRPTGWDSVVLVCRDCRKRGSGPKDFKLKPALQESRRALKRSGLRVRVVASSCLGLCPKRALAIALAGGASSPAIVAVETPEALAPALAALAEAVPRHR